MTAQDIAALNWQVHVQQQRIWTDLRIAYYDAVSAQVRRQLAEEFRSVAEQAVKLAGEKLEADVGTRPDLLQSEIQLSEVDLLIQQADIDRSAALQQLAAVCGVVDFGDTTVAGNRDDLANIASQPLFDQESMFMEIIASSPELAVAQARVDRACANLHRQQLQAIPNVTTQLGVGADDATGTAFSNVQVSLPVPVHNSNQGNIRAAMAENTAAQRNVERIRARIRRDLARARGEYLAAAAVVQNFQSRILPNAEAALELIGQGKEAGEFDFLRVLTARRAYFDSNLQFVAALVKLAQVQARIRGNLLEDGLGQSIDYQGSDGLRGQALSGL